MKVIYDRRPTAGVSGLMRVGDVPVMGPFMTLGVWFAIGVLAGSFWKTVR